MLSWEHVLQLVGAVVAVVSAYFAARYGLKVKISEQHANLENFRETISREFEEFKEDCVVCRDKVNLHMISKPDHRNAELEEYRFKIIAEALTAMDKKIDKLDELIRNGKHIVGKGDRL